MPVSARAASAPPIAASARKMPTARRVACRHAARGATGVTPLPPGCRTRCPRDRPAPPSSGRPGRCRRAVRPRPITRVHLGLLIVGGEVEVDAVLDHLVVGHREEQPVRARAGGCAQRDVAVRRYPPRPAQHARTTTTPARGVVRRRCRSRRTSNPLRQFLLEHLAHRVAGQAVDHPHLPRPLVHRKLLCHIIDQLVRLGVTRRRTRRCAGPGRRPARRSPRPPAHRDARAAPSRSRRRRPGSRRS